MGKRKREQTVPEADKAMKSPRLDRQTVGGKSMESLGLAGLVHLQVQAAPASPSDSGDSSPEKTGVEPCHHMSLDAESVDIAVYHIKYCSEELPTCHYPGCVITWKGAGESKEGMMKCMECHFIACAGWPADRDNPQRHALCHATSYNHHVAQWYDEPNLGYCFKCKRAMLLSDDQDESSSSDDEGSDMDIMVDDERAMVASKTIKQQGNVASNTIDQQGMVASSSKVDSAKVASNYNVDWEMLASDAVDRMVARDDASGYATGDGYLIRGMPNLGNTCYMNASLQCLLALGKLRTTILGPDARLGHIGLHLKQLFVETSSGNNPRHRLNPRMILEDMQKLYREKFEIGVMEDSHEFLTSLHDALDNEVMEQNNKHPKEGEEGVEVEVFPTFSHSIFKGQLIQTVSCRSCSYISVKLDEFGDLSLPLSSDDPPPPARSVAECGNSQIPGLGLRDGAIEEAPKPLQADSCEVKDVVHSCLQTQKNDVPQEIIEVPMEALDFIPNLFDDTEDKKLSTVDFHNTKDKEKAQSSDIVHDEAEHRNSLASIEYCLELFSLAYIERKCSNCSNVAADLPETNGTKNVEPIMASANVITTIDGEQTELSDRKTCPSKRSSDFTSLSVESPSRQAYPSDSHHEVIPSDDITTEEITSATSSDDKDLASCSKANEKAESHEGVQEAAPACLPTDNQTDLLSAQDIQDIRTQTDGNVSAIQTQLFSKLPSVLTIQLKRYTSALSKLRGHVSFKEIIQLGPFMHPSSEDKDKSSYRLVGVIEHLGDTPNTGHYVAYVRGSGSSSWVCAGDLIVMEVSLEQVLRCEAYILFYERIEGN